MPTYDYECPSCGNAFEKAHEMNENPDIVCPECGKKAERKITGGAGFIMKGETSGSSCCGKANPCDSPKHCCEK